MRRILQVRQLLMPPGTCLIDAIASTTCVKAKKEALARRILQVRQLLMPPGTCLIDAIASTTCVKAKKEALARRILQVRQLLMPPGTCLINNATILNAMCDALLLALAMKPGKCSRRYRSLIA